jgi:hypothetical protein
MRSPDEQPSPSIQFELAEDAEPLTPPPQRVKADSHSKNQPAAQSRQHIVRISGVDLVAVEGVSASLAQTILSEIGADMTRWPTVKHCCAWLAPSNDISGDRVL